MLHPEICRKNTKTIYEELRPAEEILKLQYSNTVPNEVPTVTVGTTNVTETGDKLSITEVEIYRSTLNQESDRRPLREAKGYDYYYFLNDAFLDEDELVATEERSKYVRGVYSKLAGQLSFTPDKQAQAQFNSIKRAK